MRAIACMSVNRIIGNDNNQIPWRCLEDFKYFKEKTLNQKIVVGRTTFNSMGFLPNREIFVLSHRSLFVDAVALSKVKHCKVNLINSITEIPNDSWICGGANVYEQTLDLCTDLYLNVLHTECEGNVRMPWFENDFDLIWTHEITTQNGLKLEFRRYTNKLINNNNNNNKDFFINPLSHEQTK